MYCQSSCAWWRSSSIQGSRLNTLLARLRGSCITLLSSGLKLTILGSPSFQFPCGAVFAGLFGFTTRKEESFSESTSTYRSIPHRKHGSLANSFGQTRYVTRYVQWHYGKSLAILYSVLAAGDRSYRDRACDLSVALLLHEPKH